ncbi:Sodium potassium root defective [Thalictrum thalictroides]|uniref:Sodium potassium root defective n=1 Tax=Thalictrum thalictroides TaxID=46969 RepID=A0A7J6WTV1_THATH|nr:Sodium potassium root defective [Thalictrum thalictroides]
MDLFCSSPASTAICSSSVDQGSIIRLGGRAIDRHNPHLRDGRRSSSRTTSNTITTTIPSSSQLQSQAPSQLESHSKPSKKLTKFYHHKKSSRGARKSSSSTYTSTSSSAKPYNLNNTSPTGSTRYLLSDTISSDLLTECEPLPPSLVSTESPGSCSTKLEHDQCRALGQFSPPSSSTTTTSTTMDHQVVVLRVSLHCRGCERKVRKHLSKMKGVTSFNIDFSMKKVTVIGDVTPLSVLSSISRVKNAQFWPSLSSVKSVH